MAYTARVWKTSDWETDVECKSYGILRQATVGTELHRKFQTSRVPDAAL